MEELDLGEAMHSVAGDPRDEPNSQFTTVETVTDGSRTAENTAISYLWDSFTVLGVESPSGPNSVPSAGDLDELAMELEGLEVG